MTTEVNGRPPQGTFALFTARTTDGSSTGYRLAEMGAQPGHPASFYARGTWNGATITFEVSPDNATWASAKDALGAALALTADGMVNIEASLDTYVRATLSNDGASTSLNVGMVR